MAKHITQLDLFSGIGGFHLGFEKAGFKVKSYFSEIDKHAIAVYKHQFKDASMSDQLRIFEESSSQKSTLSLSEALVKILALLESAQVSPETEAALSLKQYGLSENADQVFLFGKMLKEASAQTMAETLQQSCKSLPTLGAIDASGNCLIQAGYYPKTARGCTLSDILQSPEEIGEEYFLSERSLAGLMKGQGTPQMLEL